MKIKQIIEMLGRLDPDAELVTEDELGRYVPLYAVYETKMKQVEIESRDDDGSPVTKTVYKWNGDESDTLVAVISFDD